MSDNEGKIISESSVIIDSKQKRVQIPYVVDEILSIEKGDKFKWYVKKNKNGWLKVIAIYTGKRKTAVYNYPKGKKAKSIKIVEKESEGK